PGMALAFFEKGELVYSQGLGMADVASGKPVTLQTGFNIGSISKLFTAWGVMKLVEKGRIDLDAPISQYVSQWQLPASEYDLNKVTVRALLSHTAGLSVHGYPGFPPGTELPSLAASLDGENGPVRANEPVEVILEPQTEFKYSGGGYTLLQLMIEEQTGMSFQRYMDQEVFSPLKLRNTSFHLTRKTLKGSAQGYDEEGQPIPLVRFTAQAAAGLHTTLQDMIRFTQASFEGNSVLTRETLATMREPVPETEGKYGLGYMQYKLGPIQVRGHAGSNDGWESGFFMNYQDQSGMIVLTNGSNGRDIAIFILRSWVRWKSQQARG
ncbi:MAG: serine hydrolase domain-containing protein, partial [Bacteroidota bacterium]